MIGQHQVTLIPDPDVQAWGPVLNSNPYMTADIAGWQQLPFSQAWHWAAGFAVPDDQSLGSQLTQAPTAPVLRGAATLFRLRMRFTVTAPTTVTLGFYYGATALAASNGPFWVGWDQATLAEIQYQCPTAGTYLAEMTHDPVDIDPAFIYMGAHVAFFAGVGAKVDSIEYQGQGSESLDISCLVDQVSIHHGRDDTSQQPDASSCTLDMSLDTSAAAFPDALEVGGIIRVTTTLPGVTQSTRFVGRISDIAQGWDEAGAATPDMAVAQVIAMGAQADLGRRTVGAAPWPQQLDGARVAAILAAAGTILDPLTSDPGTVQILARDVDSQPALELAQAVAQDATGLLWATRSGDVRYQDADHRRGATAALELDSCDLLVTPTWRRTSDGLVNSVSIGYGVAPDGADQPRFTGQRADSIDRYGEWALSATTQLAQLADATAMGNLLLTRNRQPVWILGALPIDVAGLDSAQTAKLLTLDLSDLVEVTGMPAAGSVPTTALLWVEGWTETLAWQSHTMEMVISGYCRTSPAPRWNDLDPAMTWNNTPPALTWDDATCMGPTQNRGRWDDVPATLRWNTVPAAITWDTWPTS